MGNTVPKHRCRKAGTASGGTEGKRSVSSAAEAVERQSEQREEEVTLTTRAGRRRAGGVPPAGGGGATVATAVTVKILMKRKDAEALVARLNAQNAWERKARMAELKRQLRAGEEDGCGSASPASSPCRDAWRPRLPPVEENQC